MGDSLFGGDPNHCVARPCPEWPSRCGKNEARNAAFLFWTQNLENSGMFAVDWNDGSAGLTRRFNQGWTGADQAFLVGQSDDSTPFCRL
jgi:hypothetical protein